MSTSTTLGRVWTGEQAPAVHRLQSGDRLSLAEFERRYQAQPEIDKVLQEGLESQPHAEFIQRLQA